MNYGLPYKGSKNIIAQWVVSHIERGEVFIDLFAGGCAVTHAALLSRRFGRIVANDIADAPMLFCKAVNGDYRDETRWISREDFARLKDTDPYVRYCWSFGNNGGNYLYAKELEPWKKALHYARVFGDNSLLREFGIDSNGSRKDITAHKDEYKKKYIVWYCREVLGSDLDVLKMTKDLKQRIETNSERLRQYLVDGLKRSGKRPSDVDKYLGTNGMAGHYFGRSQWEFPTREAYEKLQNFIDLPVPYLEIYGLQELLQSLESLESLQRLESLERLEYSQKDYRDVEIPDNAVVYCDIPYRGTGGYNGVVFDHQAFYNWVRRQKVPVYVSEYQCPPDFELIAEIQHRSRLSGTANNAVIERLFGYNTNTNKQLKLF